MPQSQNTTYKIRLKPPRQFSVKVMFFGVFFVVFICFFVCFFCCCFFVFFFCCCCFFFVVFFRMCFVGALFCKVIWCHLNIIRYFVITAVPGYCKCFNPYSAVHDNPYLCKQCRSRSDGLEAIWSGSTLFVSKFVNLKENIISCNLIG